MNKISIFIFDIIFNKITLQAKIKDYKNQL